jgi:hypothetical protein
MRLVSGGVALVAATVTCLMMTCLAGGASAQIFIGGQPARTCVGGSEPGSPCSTDDDCALGGTCSQTLFFQGFEAGLDNPAIFPVSHRFQDEDNSTTMYAFFDLEGLNFAAGRAQRTRSGVRALFEWITGPPNALKQSNDSNKVKQKTYAAVRLVFTAVPQMGTPMTIYTYGDCAEPPCEVNDPLLYPLPTEGCDAKVKVSESSSIESDPNLTSVNLKGKWKIDCKLDLPDEKDLCTDGTDDCSPEERVSARDLLETFQGKRHKVKGKGKAKSNYCDDYVGTPLPSDCVD